MRSLSFTKTQKNSTNLQEQQKTSQVQMSQQAVDLINHLDNIKIMRKNSLQKLIDEDQQRNISNEKINQELLVSQLFQDQIQTQKFNKKSISNEYSQEIPKPASRPRMMHRSTQDYQTLYMEVSKDRNFILSSNSQQKRQSTQNQDESYIIQLGLKKKEQKYTSQLQNKLQSPKKKKENKKITTFDLKKSSQNKISSQDIQKKQIQKNKKNKSDIVEKKNIEDQLKIFLKSQIIDQKLKRLSITQPILEENKPIIVKNQSEHLDIKKYIDLQIQKASQQLEKDLKSNINLNTSKQQTERKTSTNKSEFHQIQRNKLEFDDKDLRKSKQRSATYSENRKSNKDIINKSQNFKTSREYQQFKKRNTAILSQNQIQKEKQKNHDDDKIKRNIYNIKLIQQKRQSIIQLKNDSNTNDKLLKNFSSFNLNQGKPIFVQKQKEQKVQKIFEDFVSFKKDQETEENQNFHDNLLNKKRNILQQIRNIDFEIIKLIDDQSPDKPQNRLSRKCITPNQKDKIKQYIYQQIDQQAQLDINPFEIELQEQSPEKGFKQEKLENNNKLIRLLSDQDLTVDKNYNSLNQSNQRKQLNTERYKKDYELFASVKKQINKEKKIIDDFKSQTNSMQINLNRNDQIIEKNQGNSGKSIYNLMKILTKSQSKFEQTLFNQDEAQPIKNNNELQSQKRLPKSIILSKSLSNYNVPNLFDKKKENLDMLKQSTKIQFRQECNRLDIQRF